MRGTILFPLFSISIWTGEDDSNILGVDTYIFENGWRKSLVSKISGQVWTWPKLHFILVFGVQSLCHLLQTEVMEEHEDARRIMAENVSCYRVHTKS